jgi:N-succinyldiaminopimelate aminotransferase
MSEHITSIFAEMSTLAQATESINLGQGFPDTDGPEEMKEIARECIRDGRGNQYPPPHGLPALRDAVAAHQMRFYGLDINGTTDVVITTGASEALSSTILALIDDGDEVLVFEPMFDVYAAGISLARGVRVAVPLSGPGLRPNIDQLRASVTPRTRMILLNSPHNPSGIVFSRGELEAIAAIAIEYDLIVVSDEAYEHLWFDDHVHIPISTLPGMFERTVTIGSGGKLFSFTGWKVGWASGPTHLIAAVRVVRQHLSYASGGPFQYAMAHGLGMPDQYFIEYRRAMSEQRDVLSGGLAELGFDVIPSQGSYYVTTDVRSIGAPDGLTFCRELPHRVRVVAIPHQVFCDDESVGRPYVRWAFCKRPSVLREALDRLSHLALPWTKE